MARQKHDPVVARATVNLQGVSAGDYVSVDPDDPTISTLLDRAYLVLVEPAKMPEGTRPPGADAALAAAEAGETATLGGASPDA